MKTIKNILVLTSFFIALISNAALIDESNVSKYEVNIKKIELWNNTTSSWIILSETSTGSVDIAASNAGAQVASMINADVVLTFGTYTKVRATVDDEFKVKACAASGSSCMTGSWSTSGTVAASTAVGTTTPQEMTYLIDFASDVSSSEMSSNNATAITGGVQIEYTLPTAFVMDAATKSMAADIAFDVDNIFDFTDNENGTDTGYIRINFPKVTMTLQ